MTVGVVILLSMQRAAGGSLQAFLYNKDLEEWQRIADGRFAMSDYYTSLALTRPMGASPASGFDAFAQDSGGVLGPLSELESLVSLGSQSGPTSSGVFSSISNNAGQKSIVTRAHCEDRMACSLALRSATEFKHWLKLYAKCLSVECDSTYLRCLCDLLLGKPSNGEKLAGVLSGDRIDVDSIPQTQKEWPVYANSDRDEGAKALWWWLGSSSDKILGLVRSDLVRIVVAEMGRNRDLQRLTNEIMIEISNL